MNATAPSPTSSRSHSCKAATARTAPPALWRVAQAFLATLHMLFGAPEAVATRHTLTAQAHAHMASWLRCAEAMLRRLILIEAGAIAKPNTRPLLRVSRKRARKLVEFWPDKPEAWRVSFRVFTQERRLPAGKTPEPGTPSRVDTPCRLEAGAPRPFVFRENRAPPPPRALSLSKGGATFTGLRRAQASQPGKRLLRQDREWVMHEPKIRFRSAWPLAERYEALLRAFNDPAPYARRAAARLHATPHRLSEALRAPPEAARRIDRFQEFRECAERAWRPPRFSSA